MIIDAQAEIQRASQAQRDLSNRQIAQLILDVGGILLTAIDDLNAAIANLQTAEAAETAEINTLVGALQGVQATLAELQAQVASGGAVTADQLNAVTSQVTSITEAANAAVAAAQSATGGAPPPPPAG